MTDRNESVFSDKLLDTLKSKREKLEGASELEAKKIKEADPLKVIPKPQMRLYGISGIGLIHSIFFDTEEELIEYVKTHDLAFGTVCAIEFLGKVADCPDVIRAIYADGRNSLYTAVDENGYGVYNHKESARAGKFTWNYQHGNIRAMYAAFRERGIKLEYDVYQEIAERDAKIMESWQPKGKR